MSTVILKNLYRNGDKVKQMWRNGEKLYQMFERFFFDVDTDSIEFEYEGSTTTITINASDPWTMTLPEWVTASTISGAGSATVTLTTTQNPTQDAQTGSIVITCEDRIHTIEVEQKGSVGLGTPLTFEITGDGNILWKATNSSITKTVEYCKNGGEWISITSTTGGVQISVVSGDTVQFRGNNTNYGNTSNYTSFVDSTCQFKVYGNIMSLLNSTNFSGLTTIPSGSTFYSMFRRCSGLTDASQLFLPATTLKSYCYDNLFRDCSSLSGAPILSAATLMSYSYRSAFNGCRSLNYIKCLATDISASNCTDSWVDKVASTGTFVKKIGVNWPSGNNGIPTGWTVIEVDE